MMIDSPTQQTLRDRLEEDRRLRAIEEVLVVDAVVDGPKPTPFTRGEPAGIHSLMSISCHVSL